MSNNYDIVDSYTESSRDAVEVAGDCYVELSKYVAKTRAYPSVTDGMKAVYRRVIYAARVYNNKVKSASIVGDSLKYHPHGDSSVYSALVSMTCKYGKFPLFDGKGNFGGLGFPYAAMRYTEAKLSDLARLMYLELIDYAEFIDSETGYSEPKYLPALIPYCLLVGAGGMSVGLPNVNIPPFDAMDLVNYYIDTLEGNETTLPRPDYGNVILNFDKSYSDELLESGVGKLWFEGVVVKEDYNKFVITCETPNSSFWKVNKALQSWIDQELVDYIDETDKSGSRHVYIVNNTSKLNPDEVEYKIKKALRCSLSYKFIFEHNSSVVYSGLDYVVKTSLKYLRECAIRKFISYKNKSETQLIILKAITALKESGYLSEVAKMSSEELINIIVGLGFEEWVAKDAIKKPISYLTKSHDDEIKSLEDEISQYSQYVDNPDPYLLTLYYKLKDMISERYENSEHSIFINEIGMFDDKKVNLVNNHVEVSNDETGIEWDYRLIGVTNLGATCSKPVSKTLSGSFEFDTSDDELEKYVGLGSDKYKYVVMVVDNKYISVLMVDDIKYNFRRHVKSWGHDWEVHKVIFTNSEELTVIDDKKSSWNIKLSDYIKSRTSYPTKISRRNIVELKEI